MSGSREDFFLASIFLFLLEIGLCTLCLVAPLSANVVVNGAIVAFFAAGAAYLIAYWFYSWTNAAFIVSISLLYPTIAVIYGHYGLSTVPWIALVWVAALIGFLLGDGDGHRAKLSKSVIRV